MRPVPVGDTAVLGADGRLLGRGRTEQVVLGEESLRARIGAPTRGSGPSPAGELPDAG